MLPVLAFAVDVYRLPSLARRRTSYVLREYKRYQDVVNDGNGFPSEFPGVFVDDLNDVFA